MIVKVTEKEESGYAIYPYNSMEVTSLILGLGTITFNMQL